MSGALRLWLTPRYLEQCVARGLGLGGRYTLLLLNEVAPKVWRQLKYYFGKLGFTADASV